VSIDYEDILNIFFAVHNPTTLNRQGNDIGPQYRSIILCDTQEKKALAEKMIKKIESEKNYPDPIVTELKLLEKFIRPKNTLLSVHFADQAAHRINPRQEKQRKKAVAQISQKWQYDSFFGVEVAQKAGSGEKNDCNQKKLIGNVEPPLHPPDNPKGINNGEQSRENGHPPGNNIRNLHQIHFLFNGLIFYFLS